MERDTIYDFLEKYLAGGDILDLGCGTGRTGLELDIKKYQYYVGVDISEVAINQARIECRENPDKNSRNYFVISDISKYMPDRKYDVILFRESLYYINQFLIPKILEKYRKYLSESGVMIVRISDRRRYKNIIRNIELKYKVIEKKLSANSGMIIIVFR
jgi:SAM-dependent methyltransferase